MAENTNFFSKHRDDYFIENKRKLKKSFLNISLLIYIQKGFRTWHFTGILLMSEAICTINLFIFGVITIQNLRATAFKQRIFTTEDCKSRWRWQTRTFWYLGSRKVTLNDVRRRDFSWNRQPNFPGDVFFFCYSDIDWMVARSFPRPCSISIGVNFSCWVFGNVS